MPCKAIIRNSVGQDWELGRTPQGQGQGHGKVTVLGQGRVGSGTRAEQAGLVSKQGAAVSGLEKG